MAQRAAITFPHIHCCSHTLFSCIYWAWKLIGKQVTNTHMSKVCSMHTHLAMHAEWRFQFACASTIICLWPCTLIGDPWYCRCWPKSKNAAYVMAFVGKISCLQQQQCAAFAHVWHVLIVQLTAFAYLFLSLLAFRRNYARLRFKYIYFAALNIG